jgi:hypothetical protein
MSRSIALSAAFLVSVMCAAADVRAQTVEVAPFVGLGFGGSLVSPALDEAFSIKSGVTYGVTVDLPIAPMWRFEALYSRQESRIDGAGAGLSLGLDVERYMVGVQEEKAWREVRFIGTFLAGATRFVPSGYDSEFWFSVALGLGVKTFPTKRMGTATRETPATSAKKRTGRARQHIETVPVIHYEDPCLAPEPGSGVRVPAVPAMTPCWSAPRTVARSSRRRVWAGFP